MNKIIWSCVSFALYGLVGRVLWQGIHPAALLVTKGLTFLGFEWMTEGGIIPFFIYGGYALWVLSVVGYSLTLVRIRGEGKGLGSWLLLCIGAGALAMLFWVLPIVGGVLVYRLALSQLSDAPRLAVLVGIIFGAGGVFGFLGPMVVRVPEQPSREFHLRGSHKIGFSKVRRLLQKRERFSPFLGGVYLAVARATQHFLFIGRTGAGKSFSIDVLLWNVLPAVGREPDHRALVYDHKGVATSFVTRMDVPWKLFNPFDMRSVAWDIQADCEDEAGAREMAEILLPLRKDAQPFFPMAAQELFVGIAMTFLTNEETWDLFDVVSTMRDQEKLKGLLARTPAGRNLMGLYFEMREGIESKSGHDVRATAFTYLGRLATVAAAWRKLGEKNGAISLRAWANNRGRDNYVLILGRANRNDVVMQAMYQLIFARVVQEIEGQRDSVKRRTWVVFDEAFMVGRLPKLENLLVFGRSKGAVVVWGFQSWLGIEELYGRELASQIIGQFGHCGFFRMDADSAKKVSDAIGQQQLERYRQSRSVNGSDRSISISHQWDEKTEPLTLPSDLSGKQMQKPGVGLPGSYMSVDLDTEVGMLWEHTLSSLWVGWMRHQLYGERFLIFPAQQSKEVPVERIPSNWATSGDWAFDGEGGGAEDGATSMSSGEEGPPAAYPLIWVEDDDDVSESVELGEADSDEPGYDFPPM
ncbi:MULTISPECIES: type IV secretion system DNA-binding domain-containing protein [Cyanophyceae]|uniref:type IV secretion system DNA-binding domain-containing protein n=1 Tax=Cyanophyceae TaxID=3028117 RepID=UPI001682A15C|nr:MULTISPECIES: type IV secretion system DNA-binding domain-containing protein [Cyanophyceae]MBD1919441.1 type IV secretion system DNA-binding domain-containing protein [Phormidium sp. FACHB-77]MBD2054293.1 type IV secretion system DNA-binding domain-containing protein [Leptolyngbya sp. FACHB-60]